MIKCPPFLHNDTNATWFGTANYLLIFWESLASFKKRFGKCVPVSGHMKVVLLDPYRAEDTELSATSLILNMFPSTGSECITGNCFVVCLMTCFFTAVCSFWGHLQDENVCDFYIL